LIDKGSAPRFSVTRHTIVSEENGLFHVTGRTEPYRAHELLLAGAEDEKEKEKQVQREAREAEKLAARRESRIDRRIAKDGIERYMSQNANPPPSQAPEPPRRSGRDRKAAHSVIDKRYEAIIY